MSSIKKEKEVSLKSLKGKKHAVLPLRDIVVFPHMIVPLFVGRAKSIQALEAVMQKDQPLLLVTQKDPTKDDPNAQELYCFGTVGHLLQLLKLPDGTVKVLAEGLGRARVLRYDAEKDYLQALIEPMPDNNLESVEANALKRLVVGQFERYIKLNGKVVPDILSSVAAIKEPDKLADTITAHLSIGIPEKQMLLEQTSAKARLEKILALMETEISILQTEKRLHSRVKRQMEKTQREYYLNEQMKAIQKELGEGDESRSELDEIEEKIEKTKLSKEARTKAKAELKKLRLMNPMSSEATVVRNYLDWLLSIPWKKRTQAKVTLKEAERILEADHYGLEKVKERILEYLAVQSRVGTVQGSILCLVGPPGVGKTSLAQSIARATGRQYGRVALGGVRDEAEIRGHRRTYIGSMPGKIIQGIRKAGSSNPLFLLDELDKLGSDWRGDPSSALLEVLDPAQNAHFNDHYLEVDYDLSDVLFLTTANNMEQIPYPLQDRLEVIRLSGYTEDEKMEIALRHLIPKQCEMVGLKSGEWSIEDNALRKLIQHYTREAGVRNLQRELANLTRKAVKELLTQKKRKTITVTTKNLKDYAGVKRYRYGEAEKKHIIGVTTGLAWTEVGGEILTIEAVLLSGKGKVTATGKLGDVMQESVQAAFSYVRSRSIDFGLMPPLFAKKDIHVHVPEGATPKDGPSAGVAMCTSIVSVLTGIPVRKDVAMTGEITLTGRILAIGGLKEKLLAAHRGGVKKVLIPYENEKDLEEIPDNVQQGLMIIPVRTADEVLSYALTKKLTPIVWEENLSGLTVSASSQKESPSRPH